MTRTTRKITLVAVVAMLALGTSMALAGTAPHATTDATAENPAAVQETTTMAETANVTFENQTSNGTAVMVEEVVVPEGGFVAIHAAEATDEMATETQTGTTAALDTTAVGGETAADEEDAAEADAAGDWAQQYQAGEVLGNSTYLEPGVHENVTVQLDSQLEESQVLIAMLHLDTNDNQQYEFPEADDPYTENGEAVVDAASVTLEEEGNETMAGDEETTTEEM